MVYGFINLMCVLSILIKERKLNVYFIVTIGG